MKRLVLFVSLLACGASFAPRAFAQSIAVWNPEQGTSQPPNRFVLDPAKLDQAATWLWDAGLNVGRVTAAQLEDATAFSAQKYDALVMQGDAFPKSAVPALLNFTNNGGVLIALSGRIPFSARIVQTANGQWDLSPNQGFAWQSNELLGPLGIRYIYDPPRHDQGVRHTPSPLFQKYVPAAAVMDRKLPSMWLVPTEGGAGASRFYPLLRSQRVDGADVTPQIFVVRSGPRTAIISLSGLWTQDADPTVWQLSRQTTVALAKLAVDLHAGKVDLGQPIALRADLPIPEPLRTRIGSAGVKPEGATALESWGQFDGTSGELGGPVAAGESAQVAAGGIMPRSLEAGAKITLQLRQGIPTGKAAFLRVRGAYSASHAGLKVTVGGQTLWNELFSYADASGESNFYTNSGTRPAEFNRVVFIPASSARNIEIANPGREPVYFDAVQLETHDKAAPRYMAGTMLVDLAGAGTKVPVELSREWNVVRGNLRTQQIGPPGDPARFKSSDDLMARFQKTGAPIHLLLEGTPEWAAISPERYEAGKKAGRPHTVPPDPVKYAAAVEELVRKYGDAVGLYEIWNEADISQFWRGSPAEYAAFYKAVAAAIRKHDPDARIISAGMAGYNEDVINTLAGAGVFKDADYIGFHPYNGPSPGWDVAYGQLQGKLYSLGIDTEIYCDESGFTWRSEKDAPTVSGDPQAQSRNLDAAMGRVLANGLTALNVFHASASQHEFDLIDKDGVPRPAYVVLRDYLTLGANGGRRLDVSLSSTDETPLQGIYAAASTHTDGSITVILNGSTAPVWEQKVILRLPILTAGNWNAVAFSGASQVPIEFRPSAGAGLESVLNVRGRVRIELRPGKN